ncbi:hypothetical protein G6L29_31145 [Agrobacterium rhizogenes]|uniref:Cytochrome c oxidase subunit IV n=1 Tax=Rhizobium rhizogenes NBRC 13257 TaxID=1220581 RepID=A0AA87QGV9_RHIRH|nr:cytochrome C oxidase subunit IV family protein [Rhizobium rhizogenes]NTG65106.1 hypothetical protein [Rhizobium rhizogenes]NTG71557.1 hypothetical protein [Rhizobium rhizogenes]NTG84456.1 hypothetical protein [Rhizobium rhizogenes]NTG90850.1 hypothetical protein [Rhizobium rhizogenes]NTH29484.1 hypothetical protein [Rhizobium rhizogenes]
MALKELVPFRVALTWAILVALSILGSILGIEGEDSTLIAVIVLAFAVIKVRFVGLDFMELCHAPLAMRAAFEAYCVVLLGTLTGLYAFL